MRRGSILLVAAVLAVVGLLSNVIASDLWERIRSSPWYSLPIAILVFIGLTALVAWFQHRHAQPDSSAPAVALSPQDRTVLLDKIYAQRVKDRLEQGLRKAIRVDLTLTETAAAVGVQLRIHNIGEFEPPVERRTEDDIAAIFRAAQGSLLILGDPGTGKTNLLLELTEALLQEARSNPEAKIPVVFSLPRWTLGEKPRTLAEWLVTDLAHVAQYGLSRATAEGLVRGNRILPLLDGLDEVADSRRAACVEAIHAYQSEHDLVQLAVCCRVAEYQPLPQLNLRTAVRVEKLTREDVDRYLSMDRLRHVGRALRADPELLAIIDTPLWLHVAFLAAQVEPPPGLGALPPRDRLYRRFVQYALGRKPDIPSKQQTPEPDFLRWTYWLARQMKERNQMQFALEQLNYTWLFTDRWVRLLGATVTGIAFGLLLGLEFWLTAAPIVTLVGGLAGGLIAGLLLRSEETFGEPVEELQFIWAGRNRGLVFGLAIGLAGGLIGGLRGGPVDGLLVGLFGALGGRLYGAGESLLRSKPATIKIVPNRGTKRSLCYFGVILFAGALAQSLAVLALRGSHWFNAASLLGPVAGALGFSKGGQFAVNHYAVRLLLWHKNAAPLRYVRFLNEAVDRLFLIRNGGTYEFFHISFRDYLANLPERR